MKKVFSTAVAVSAFVGSSAANAAATGPDLTPLTASIDPGTTVTGVLAVAASLVLIHMAMKGAKMIMSMIKSG